MDRSDIIKLFLKHGSQVDDKALKLIEAENSYVDRLIQRGNLPHVITEETLKEILPQSGVELIKPTAKQPTTAKDLQQVLIGRYNFLRGVIEESEPPNLISINKISKKTQNFSVIGMIAEINQSIILEDNSGQNSFIPTDPETSKFLVEDEVIGVVCERINDQNIIKQIIHPDTPLRKDIISSKKQTNYLFISDLQMDSPKFNLSFYEKFHTWLKQQKNMKLVVLGKISDKPSDVDKFFADLKGYTTYIISDSTTIKAFSDPAFVRDGNINFVFTDGKAISKYSDKWKTKTVDTITNLLKKRHLDPTMSPTNNETFLLDVVPDVIVCGNSNEVESAVYKGTTILTTGNFLTTPIYWTIDLSNREILKVDFS